MKYKQKTTPENVEPTMGRKHKTQDQNPSPVASCAKRQVKNLEGHEALFKPYPVIHIPQTAEVERRVPGLLMMVHVQIAAVSASVSSSACHNSRRQCKVPPKKDKQPSFYFQAYFEGSCRGEEPQDILCMSRPDPSPILICSHGPITNTESFMCADGGSCTHGYS